MVQFIRRLAVLSLIAGLAPAGLVAQQQERAKIPEKYQWNLTEIYPDDQAWRAAKDKLVAEIPERPRRSRGRLDRQPQKLADALELGSRLARNSRGSTSTPSMMSDQDTRVSTYQGMQQEMEQLGANFGAETSFVEPEILKIDRATIDKFIAQEPRLKVYTLLPPRHPAPPRAHADRRRGEASRELLGRGRRARRTSTASSPTPTSRIRRSR